MTAIFIKRYTFTNLDQVLDHLAILEKSNYIETTGLWSFYQILTHCKDHIHYSMNGFPYYYAAFFRKTLGKYLLSKLLKRGYMEPNGYNGDTISNRVEGNEMQALNELREAIYAFRSFNGEFASHPMYDKMDKATWEKFHSMHIANHLSFVEYLPEKMRMKDSVSENLGKEEPISKPSIPVTTLSKLEAMDAMIRKPVPKSKGKIKNVIQKRTK
ncbi:MAG TPA: DUF1569 domain-containing protein [Leptospiraceae bacterium]|nr:DUF1569 domain-containing protein [Leptospiraceae bacterium]HMW03841.1 DUF1569 domain-containing protein [Leptospiraceae bacterium]HMX32890.1 DUF1569 domain-containing protein [Leptospiraceae bacterium]HMY29821.1 DUF1569 domain-containing protein [Leptospiraceae bacterium]HMZ65197.1 DUF1569 domain-containing protein [Leptospiraceae bacterium]